MTEPARVRSVDGIERIDSGVERRALFDPTGGKSVEQQALAAAAGQALMVRAGESVARLALAIAPHAEHVHVFAGPGNNGGDGLEAARCLHRWGRRVTVDLLAGESTPPGDTALALARARDAGVAIVSGIGGDGGGGRDRPGLVIDALLGIGASRAPTGALAAAIARIGAWRAQGAPVLAVDVPTGLDPGSGLPFGDSAVSASHTLALLTLQAGLFTASGRDAAGDVWLSTLGVDVERLEADPIAWLVGHGGSDRAVLRRHARHKGSFGDVGVVGGAPGMTGAALLAARAAHAAGAGRVFVDLLDDAPSARGLDTDPLRPELMVRRDWWQGPRDEVGRSTVVCGCGGGDAVRAALPRLTARAPRLVLDADALNALAVDPGLQAAVAGRAHRGHPTVLTPHPLEAARLLGCDIAEVQSARLQAARQIAERHQAIVVLKGSGTIIAAPGQTPFVNATGNASLAGAGTGDVLAGWLGGRWASDLSDAAGDPSENALRIVVQAVVEHGRAAEPARPGALRASDLIEALHRLDRGRE